MEEYIKYWKNYINFSGRSTRKEFWLPVLFNFLICLILNAINTKIGSIFSLIVLIPNIANQIRRFHDVNKSGWNVCWVFLPIVGWIIMLVSFCKATVDEGNIYSDVEE